MQYKVIFIDWDGTLSNSRFWERWNTDAAQQSKYEAIQKALFRNMGMASDWMLGKLSYAEVLTDVSKVTNIPYDALVHELRYSCENMQYIEQNTIELIQQLRTTGAKIVISTDNMDTFNEWTAPALRLHNYFDAILTSDVIGAFKAQAAPDGTSKFFSEYLHSNNIQSHQAILVDNGLNNKAVEDFGMGFMYVTDEAPLSQHLRKLFNSRV